MTDIKHVIQITSGCQSGCEHCNDGIERNGNLGVHGDYFVNAINHYVQKHNYKILHIGQYTDTEVDDGLWHGTTAILGHTEILPPREITPGEAELNELLES
jgi:hypothetical protein